MLTIVDAESVVSIEVFDESAVEEKVGLDGVVGLGCDVACTMRVVKSACVLLARYARMKLPYSVYVKLRWDLRVVGVASSGVPG